MGNICTECQHFVQCETKCPAFMELDGIYREQDTKDKTSLIRGLRKRFGIVDAERSRELETLAKKVMEHFPEFSFVKEFGIRIGYVVSQEKKAGERVTYADCRKVPTVYRAYLPFDFIITFYERNTCHLSDNQKKILMWHELKHIGIGERGIRVVPHDIEDFTSVLEQYGLKWNTPGEELPDMFGGG